MLVLSRKLGERICIGDQIVLTVMDVHGDRVKLGVDAPREISVHREEVLDRIRHERCVPVQMQPGESPFHVECA